MTNPDCQKKNRHGDCIARNCRVLCPVCSAALSADELREREIAFTAKKLRRSAKDARPGCRRTDGRTCKSLLLCCPCPGCVAGMNDRQLVRYAVRLYERAEESRLWWKEYDEGTEYMRELKARGITGIDWNLEASQDSETPYLIAGIFHFSTPCFIHKEDSGL